VTSQSNAVSTTSKSLGNLQALLEKYRHQIAVAIPNHLTPERLIRIVLTAVGRSPGLLECDPLTICGCVIQAAQLGLEPDGVLAEAFLVPFYNSKTRKKECALIPGYQGLLKLARNSGELKFVNAQVVREKDFFEFVEGSDPSLTHKRAAGDRGKTTAYWAGASLKTGGFQFVVMTRREAEEHRDRFSRAKDTGPWKDDFDTMALKTCLRRLCKLLPKSTQAQIATSLDEAHEAGRSQAFSCDVPVELHPPPEEEPAPVPLPRRVSGQPASEAPASEEDFDSGEPEPR
jgi:recombination protein RecT